MDDDNDPTLEEVEAMIAKLEAPHKNYWERLGAFVAQFAATEHILLDTIKELAGVDGEIGAALLGGVRVHDGVSLLNRVLDATDRAEVKARLKPALDQLGQINSTRNNIIHWGAEHVGTEDEFLVTNAHLIHGKQIPIAYTVRPVELENMTIDLQRIDLHLMRERGHDEETQEFYDILIRNRVFDFAWLYKATQRAAPRQRNLEKPPRRPRQPQSFQKSRKTEE